MRFVVGCLLALRVGNRKENFLGLSLWDQSLLCCGFQQRSVIPIVCLETFHEPYKSAFEDEKCYVNLRNLEQIARLITRFMFRRAIMPPEVAQTVASI